jgi:crossover junction endodeoxyribonuclease RuvC
VKLAAAGHGRADKAAVSRAVVARLGLSRSPANDATDALALALCHLQQAPLAGRIAAALRAEGA